MTFERIELRLSDGWENDELARHVRTLVRLPLAPVSKSDVTPGTGSRTGAPITLHVQRARADRVGYAITAALGATLCWQATVHGWGGEWFVLGLAMALGALWNMARDWHGCCSGCRKPLPPDVATCPACRAVVGGSLGP